jgi:tetratricopeptide (TPR) repeat protein
MNESLFWNELGKIYLRLDAFDDAVAAFSRAVDLDDPQQVYLRDLASAYFRQGKNLDAIGSYLKFILLTDSREEKIAAWNQVGDSYRRMDDYEKAIGAYRKAAELSREASNLASREVVAAEPNPDLSQHVSFGSGDAPRSKASALLPDPPAQAWTAGSPPSPVGNPVLQAEVAPFWKDDLPGGTDAVSSDPAGLADQLFGKNVLATEPAPAQAPIIEVIERDRAPVPDQNPAELRRLTNDRATFKKLTQMSPNDDVAWQGLGRSCRDLGDYDNAIYAFEQAIRLMPQEEAYLYDLGLVYVAQKRYEEAIEAFLKVIELSPGYALAHCALAGCYRRLGMDAEAEQHIQIARPMMDLEKEYNRACFEAMSGHADLAIALLKVALETKQTTMAWVRSDPDLDFVRDDPRFRALVSNFSPALEKEW